MHGTPKAWRCSNLWIIFILITSFAYNGKGEERQHRKTFVVRYKNGDNTVPVTVVLDFHKQAEYVINMNSRARTKSVTFYDFKERAIAYKDMTNKECFIGKLTNETLWNEERILKEVEVPLEAKPLRLVLDSSRKSFTPTEVRNLAGQKIAMFCRKMTAWLLFGQYKTHKRNRRSSGAFQQSSERQQQHRFSTESPYRRTYNQKSAAKLQNEENRPYRRTKHNQQALPSLYKRKQHSDELFSPAPDHSRHRTRYNSHQTIPGNNGIHYPLANSTSHFYLPSADIADRLNFPQFNNARASYSGRSHTVPRIIPLQPIPNHKENPLSSHHVSNNYYGSHSHSNRFDRQYRQPLNQFGSEYIMPLKISRTPDFRQPPYSYDLQNNSRSETMILPQISTLHPRNPFPAVQNRFRETFPENLDEEYGENRENTFKTKAEMKTKKLTSPSSATNGIWHNKEKIPPHSHNISRFEPPNNEQSDNHSKAGVFNSDNADETEDDNSDDSEYSDEEIADDSDDDNPMAPPTSLEDGKSILKNAQKSAPLKSVKKERSDTPIDYNPLTNDDGSHELEPTNKVLQKLNQITNVSTQHGVPQRQERLDSILKLFTPDEIVIDIGKLPKSSEVTGARRLPSSINIATASGRPKKPHRQSGKMQETGEFSRKVLSRNNGPISQKLPVTVLPPGVAVYPRHPNAPYAELAYPNPVISPQKRVTGHGQRHHHKKNQPPFTTCCTNSKGNSVCCKGKGSCCTARRHRGKLVTSCCNTDKQNPDSAGHSRDFFVPQNDEAVVPSESRILGAQDLCDAKKRCRTLYRSTQAVLICREGNVPGC